MTPAVRFGLVLCLGNLEGVGFCYLSLHRVVGWQAEVCDGLLLVCALFNSALSSGHVCVLSKKHGLLQSALCHKRGSSIPPA